MVRQQQATAAAAAVASDLVPLKRTTENPTASGVYLRLFEVFCNTLNFYFRIEETSLCKLGLILRVTPAKLLNPSPGLQHFNDF